MSNPTLSTKAGQLHFDPNNGASGTCMGTHSMKMPSIYQYVNSLSETKYLLTLSCVADADSTHNGDRGVYWAEGTDLTAQDWTALNEGGGFGPVGMCDADPFPMEKYNGWYPSMISPAASPNVVLSAGIDLEMDGCLTQARHFAERGFTITDSGSLRSKQLSAPRPTAHRTPIPTSPPVSK
jgi:hypothetical protein